jgi:hypothetical protein
VKLQRQILEYLELKRVFHYKQPAGSNGGWGGFHIGPKGAPNIICVIKGQYIAIAIKTPRAKQSENQRAFQKALETAGGKYVLAFSLEDVAKALGGPNARSADHTADRD